MSVIDIQRRARRLGEIRTGTKSDKGYPVSLDTFRLTSTDKTLLEDAADRWGGTVERWGDKWEVVTGTAELPVLVPPQNVDGLVWYEQWSRGGLQKRCDGEHIVNTDGDPPPCNCDPDNRDCNPITRVNLMLPDLADIGTWLLTSTGKNAAAELPFAMELVQGLMRQTGQLPPATLVIDHREVKKPGQPDKRFVVPVLRFDTSYYQLAGAPDDTPSLPSPSVVPLAAGGDGAADGGGEPVSLPTPVEPFTTTTVTVEPDTEQLTTTFVKDETGLPVVGDDMRLIVDDEPLSEPWSGLLDTLNEDPTEGNMGAVEERLRRLYRLMRTVGLWPDGSDGRDALHWALEKGYQAGHVGDLKRAELDKFITTSFMYAEGKIGEARE